MRKIPLNWIFPKIQLQPKHFIELCDHWKRSGTCPKSFHLLDSVNLFFFSCQFQNHLAKFLTHSTVQTQQIYRKCVFRLSMKCYPCPSSRTEHFRITDLSIPFVKLTDTHFHLPMLILCLRKRVKRDEKSAKPVWDKSHKAKMNMISFGMPLSFFLQ